MWSQKLFSSIPVKLPTQKAVCDSFSLPRGQEYFKLNANTDNINQFSSRPSGLEIPKHTWELNRNANSCFPPYKVKTLQI